MDNLTSILQRLTEISDKISLIALLKAQNLESEKSEWLKNRSHKVHFEYNYSALSATCSYASELAVIRDNLKKLLQPDDDCAAFICAATLSAVNKLLTVTSIAHSIATRDDLHTSILIQEYLHGPLSPELVKQAQAIAAGDTSLFAPVLEGVACVLNEEEIHRATTIKRTPEEIANAFRNALGEYGFDMAGWSVRTGTEYQNITVKTCSDQSFIYVPSGRRPVTIRELIALIGHEVEGHTRDNMNVAMLLHIYFGASRALAKFIAANRNSILTEGLAKISDSIVSMKITGKALGTPLPWYIIAANMALSKASFNETADFLYNEFIARGKSPEAAAENAWKFTSRVYRGCTNCENPEGYAYYGDKSYLEGFTQAIDLIDKHPSARDYGKLYRHDFDEISDILKINIDEIPPAFPHLHLTDTLIQAI